MLKINNGDTGLTDGAPGQRVPKHNLAINAVGELDELNAWLGFLRAKLFATHQKISEDIFDLQKLMLEIMAFVSGWQNDVPKLNRDINNFTAKLEEQILQFELPELKTFVIPGECIMSADIHIVRTVCRRAERQLVALAYSETEILEQYIPVITILNRISEYLFELSRYLSK